MILSESNTPDAKTSSPEKAAVSRKTVSWSCEGSEKQPDCDRAVVLEVVNDVDRERGGNREADAHRTARGREDRRASNSPAHEARRARRRRNAHVFEQNLLLFATLYGPK